MTQMPGSFSHPIALDYENTLVLAIEPSKASGAGSTSSGPAADQGDTKQLRRGPRRCWCLDGYRDRSQGETGHATGRHSEDQPLFMA